MANKLASSMSPYLRQHASNPIHWQPWGAEPFEQAEREGKPVFLSIGYSSCHWCHVMAHESFENAEVASRLNSSFVSIKVDREERPDVDETYMAAVQLATGRGGWPMTLFLTPTRKPFFAGTYFPVENRPGYPGFLNLIGQVAEAWTSNRDAIEAEAHEFAEAVAQALTREAPNARSELDLMTVESCIEAAIANTDPLHGGSKGYPKFPPHSQLELLFAYGESPLAQPDLATRARECAQTTIFNMCIGGIRDHVGGGFHRYSTDSKWLLPHFEKTLYDNALLIPTLELAASCSQDDTMQKFLVAAQRETEAWLERELLNSDGMYGSALDADSEGEEGKFYVWSRDELMATLGERYEPFAKAFGVRSEGNFTDEATGKQTALNILHRCELSASFDDELAILRRARDNRPRPEFDDKALVSWNGLAIRALSTHKSQERAARMADAILQYEQELNYLPHLISEGTPSGEAFLEDYSFLILGLRRLGRLRPKYLKPARRLTAAMIEQFWDVACGGFWSTSRRHEQLLGRSKPMFDSPTPSGNGSALQCLVEDGDTIRAQELLKSMAGWLEAAPLATESLHLGLLRLLESRQSPPFSMSSTDDLRIRVKSLTRAKDEFKGILEVVVPEGHYINTASPSDVSMMPARLTSPLLDLFVSYPPCKEDACRGVVEFSFSFKGLTDNLDTIELVLEYQACTESGCLIPSSKAITIALPN